MIAKAVALFAVLAPMALAACPQARPTREDCSKACERTAEMQHKVHMEVQMLATRDVDRAVLSKQIEDAWAAARGGKVGKQIEDCAIQCEATATKTQVDCVMQAETVGQIRACRKADSAR